MAVGPHLDITEKPSRFCWPISIETDVVQPLGVLEDDAPRDLRGDSGEIVVDNLQ